VPTRTYLELRRESDLRPAACPSPGAEVTRVGQCPPSFWRYLYTEVGRAYQWVDRLGWTDDEIRDYLATPGLELWLLTVDHAPAGYFELKPDGEGGLEIAYFGLLPEFTGRGLGKYLLTEAARRAFAAGAARVWLHTCTLDHPSALPNYLARGFTAWKEEQYG
jgi:GNAT superfamily N-acetyltransferase